MGTRGAFGVRINNGDKLMYNHYDSYPEGLGADLVAQIQKLVSSQGLDYVKERAQALIQLDDSATISSLDPEIQKKLMPYRDSGVSTGRDVYSLVRGLQGQLDKVLELGIMTNANTFVDDSLFCEWAYVLNLDTGKFEIYKGFQKDILVRRGRYQEAEFKLREGYGPVALVAELPIDDNLGTAWAAFLAEMATANEE